MRRILFVELLGGIGDLVIALPAIHALGLSHPRARVTVLTFAPAAQLLESDPLVQQVRIAERGDAAHPERPREAVEALLAQERFDIIVTDTRYAGIDGLLAASGARVVTDLWRQPPPDQHIGRRFLEILHHEGLIEPWTARLRPRLALDASDRLWAISHLPMNTRNVLLHPHAGMPVKTWPERYVVSLAQALQEEMGLHVVIPEGSGAETAVAQRIAGALRLPATLLPQSSLRHYAAAAACCDLAIGADTGPLRIAAAAGALTVTLFGPSWHGRYGQPPPHENLQGCSTCHLRDVADFTRQPCWYAGTCPLGGWQSCLEDISVGDVLEAANRLLGLTAWWGRSLRMADPKLA